LCILAATVTDQEICLVPRTAQPGDILFILYGAKLPFVLRLKKNRVTEGSDEDSKGGVLRDGLEYEVVGPCWIPEQMWGQAIETFDDNPDSQAFQMVLV